MFADLRDEVQDDLEEAKKKLRKTKTQLKKAKDLLKDFSDNWDCDENGHEYGTGCRCCQAEALLKELK